MKARITLATVAIVAVLALGFAIGCQRGRTDAQVTNDVQTKINSDPAVQSRQYTVNANNGVVTLGGTVNSDTERASASADAAQVAGVKTVVNNIQVTPPVVAQEAAPPVAAAPPPAPAEPSPAKHRKPSGIGRQQAPPAPTPEAMTPMAETAPPPPPAPALPPPPPQPVAVTIPEGSTLSIRLVDAIDSERNQAGDTFRATLDTPVTLNDSIVIPAGADVSGKVTDAKSAARFSGHSALALQLMNIRVNGKTYDLQTDQYSRQGASRGKNTGEKVGGGALLGAIIGGIAGGGKGAAVGAGVGAGAGGTAQAVTRGQQIRLTSEQILPFHLQSPLTVIPSNQSNRSRQQLNSPE
jgi:hypothetical protein